jgi:hypothetical protein
MDGNMILLLAMLLAVPGSDNAVSTTPLRDVLSKTARSVERFWDQFASVNCTETVIQEKIGKEGKVLYQHNSTYDYLIFLNLEGDDLSVEESRLMQKEAGKSSNFPLLLTSGFSTMLLVFHPYYQGSFEFRQMDDEIVDGRKLSRLSFRHVHGSRSTSAVRLRGIDYPLDLTGTAWIDPGSGVIQKISAGLEAPMDDLNLRQLKAEVRYAPQQFNSEKAEWLPATASIDVETAKQHWRNIHKFSNYRRFEVKSESSVTVQTNSTIPK